MNGGGIEPAGEPRLFPDVVALDRELFASVAQTHPGVVRTLGVLIAELTDLDDLPPKLTRALGEHLQRVGQTVINRAERARGDADAE